MSINALNWFEIPVSNMQRASQFYSSVTGGNFREEVIGGNQLAVFSYEQPGVGGCLVKGSAYVPGNHGAVVYLAIKDNLNAALERVKAAGGMIATGNTRLPGEMGCYAHIIDTEGNRVGLHAIN
ncbi:MAG: VOC family protein [Steroidobacter sp.]